MVTKEEVEARVEEGSSTLFHAGVSFHRALMDIETANPDDAIEDLKQCRKEVDEAIKQYHTVIEVASTGLSEERGYPQDNDRTEILFDNLETKWRVEELLYDDRELWEFLRSAAIQNDPLAGYELFASLMSEFRNGVNGLLGEIDRGADMVRVKMATWRTMTTYQRLLTLGQMIAFINTNLQLRQLPMEET